jgi:hypothetical protein
MIGSLEHLGGLYGLPSLIANQMVRLRWGIFLVLDRS